MGTRVLSEVQTRKRGSRRVCADCGEVVKYSNGRYLCHTPGCNSGATAGCGCCYSLSSRVVTYPQVSFRPMVSRRHRGKEPRKPPCL